MIKVGNLLEPLVQLLKYKITNYDIAYADETRLKVLKKEKQSLTNQSYMWLFSGGPPQEKSFVYEYHPGRSEHIANDFFTEFKGFLHADCYGAYVKLGKTLNVTHVACMAHARRYFMDIVKVSKGKKGVANKTIEKIAKLYVIERELKDTNASADEIYDRRQKESLPLLENLKEWLYSNSYKTPPKSSLGKAIAYSINHWESLINYTKDGRLEIDNNRSERSIKPFVIGRKNWLFHGNEIGARAGATLYSLIETCKAHNVDTFAYFKYVLSKIVFCKNSEDFEKLLPFNCPKESLDLQRSIPELLYPDTGVD